MFLALHGVSEPVAFAFATHRIGNGFCIGADGNTACGATGGVFEVKTAAAALMMEVIMGCSA